MFQIRSAFKACSGLIAAGLMAGCATGQASSGERSALFEAVAVELRDDLARADQHVLIVRHARKADEACNDLPCPLGEDGLAMVSRLDALLGEPDFDLVMSTGACRTYETARIAGDVIMHAAAPSAAGLCGGGETQRTRREAFADVQSGLARWTLIAEHSNTSCGWVGAMAGQDQLIGTLCESGALSSEDYGDIFWLYRVGEDWFLTVLEDAFDLP